MAKVPRMLSILAKAIAFTAPACRIMSALQGGVTTPWTAGHASVIGAAKIQNPHVMCHQK